MKMRKLLFSMMAVIAMALTTNSCSKGTSEDPTEESTTTTVAQDKQNIKNTINGFYDCMNTLDDGDFSNFILYSFFNNTDHVFNSTYLENIFEKFELQYGNFVINDKFQFANRTGIYTWNTATKSWSKIGSSSVITLKFPSKENQQTIDTEATLDGFSDTVTVFNTSTLWMPKTFNFVVKRSDKTVFSMNLSNVTFDTGTNFSMPLSADINIFTAPFTHKITWRRMNTKEFELNYNSSTPNGCVTSLVANVMLQHSDYGNMTSIKNDVKQVKGSISEGNLKITYAVNAEVLAAISSPTAEQINSNAKVEALYNGKKIGDLILKKIGNSNEIFIVYSDGTSENTDVYVADFETKVKAIFANYL